MNVSASNHTAEEAESWARALTMEAGDDPDQEIGNPKVARWTVYVPYARLALLARDRIVVGGPLSIPKDDVDAPDPY